MTAPCTCNGAEATILGHKHEASQVTLGPPKRPRRDSHPVLQEHANPRALVPVMRFAVHCAPKAGLGTPANLPHQKGSEFENPEDRAPPLYVRALHTSCLPRDIKRGQATQ